MSHLKSFKGVTVCADEVLTPELGKHVIQFHTNKLILKNVQEIEGQSYGNCNPIVKNIQLLVAPKLQSLRGGALSWSFIERMKCPNLKLVESDAISNATNLRQIDLESVECIERCAIYKCQSLVDVVNKRVQTLPSEMVQYCYNLRTVHFENATEIASSFMLGCKVHTLSLPKLQRVADQSYHPRTKVQAITHHEKLLKNWFSQLTESLIPEPAQLEEMLRNYDTKDAKSALTRQNIRGFTQQNSLVLPPRILKIDTDVECKFVSFMHLAKVEELPQSFCQFNEFLVSLEAPNVRKIGQACFKQNYQLQTVRAPLCRSLGGEAFSECCQLATLEMPLLETIGAAALSGCALRRISFPNCTRVGKGSFSYYAGQRAELAENAEVDASAFKFCVQNIQLKGPRADSEVFQWGEFRRACKRVRRFFDLQADGKALAVLGLSCKEFRRRQILIRNRFALKKNPPKTE